MKRTVYFCRVHTTLEQCTGSRLQASAQQSKSAKCESIKKMTIVMFVQTLAARARGASHNSSDPEIVSDSTDDLSGFVNTEKKGLVVIKF
jgi:hypothetical protein